MENISLNKPEWDYTEQAKYYFLRPNYTPKAIDLLLEYVKVRKNDETYITADIGAGTGNLSVMLEERGLTVIAVEPNASMRNIGIDRTVGKKIKWVLGTGEETTLDDKSVDFITFGSSFNTTEREKTLAESYRVLKDDAFFCCMWNNRELEKDPTQKTVENIIKKYVPNYTHGTRRESQTDVIKESKLFKNIYYIEEPQLVEVDLENYIEAWKSVKNIFWDLSTKEGNDILNNIIADIRSHFADTKTLQLTYTTKIWVAQKNN